MIPVILVDHRERFLSFRDAKNYQSVLHGVSAGRFQCHFCLRTHHYTILSYFSQVGLSDLMKVIKKRRTNNKTGHTRCRTRPCHLTIMNKKFSINTALLRGLLKNPRNHDIFIVSRSHSVRKEKQHEHKQIHDRRHRMRQDFKQRALPRAFGDGQCPYKVRLRPYPGKGRGQGCPLRRGTGDNRL